VATSATESIPGRLRESFGGDRSASSVGRFWIEALDEIVAALVADAGLAGGGETPARSGARSS
jgi:hypothetical protein